MPKQTTTTQPTLEPFGAADFDAYAGVETANPLIGSTHGIDVIVDGGDVTAIADYSETEYNATFPTQKVAELVALDILRRIDPEGDETLEGILKDFGF